MNAVISVLRFVVFLYILVLIGRLVFDWIRFFAKEWKPRGGALVVAEPIYTLTEPPLRALRRVIPPLLNDFIALMKDTSLVSVLGAAEVVYIGRQLQSDFVNGSGLIAGAILFLIVTIPLARFVDVLIARQQAQFQRGLA